MSARSSGSEYSYPAHWSASYREPPRSTNGIAAVQTAIEYELTKSDARPDELFSRLAVGLTHR